MFKDRVWTVKVCFSLMQRPLILKVPQSESFSSLSDIMRRLQPRQSSSTQLRRGAKTTVSELSSSMMDLSVMHTDPGFKEKGTSVPQASVSVRIYDLCHTLTVYMYVCTYVCVPFPVCEQDEYREHLLRHSLVFSFSDSTLTLFE